MSKLLSSYDDVMCRNDMEKQRKEYKKNDRNFDEKNNNKTHEKNYKVSIFCTDHEHVKISITNIMRR